MVKRHLPTYAVVKSAIPALLLLTGTAVQASGFGYGLRQWRLRYR
jgi:hypothetical protein